MASMLVFVDFLSILSKFSSPSITNAVSKNSDFVVAAFMNCISPSITKTTQWLNIREAFENHQVMTKPLEGKIIREFLETVDCRV